MVGVIWNSKDDSKMKIDDHKAIPIVQVSFRHLYNVSGFKVSKELIEPNKANFVDNPRGTHACLQHGYWCWSNLFTHPEQFKIYLKVKWRRLLSLLDKRIKV